MSTFKFQCINSGIEERIPNFRVKRRLLRPMIVVGSKSCRRAPRQRHNLRPQMYTCSSRPTCLHGPSRAFYCSQMYLLKIAAQNLRSMTRRRTTDTISCIVQGNDENEERIAHGNHGTREGNMLGAGLWIGRRVECVHRWHR